MGSCSLASQYTDLNVDVTAVFFLEMTLMVCLFIVERSDTASNEALCWLVCMCLTRVECLKFVHPDVKRLSLPSATHVLHVILWSSY